MADVEHAVAEYRVDARAPRSLAVPSSVCRTLSLLKNGNACHTSAAAPDTCGAASDVPRHCQ